MRRGTRPSNANDRSVNVTTIMRAGTIQTGHARAVVAVGAQRAIRQFWTRLLRAELHIRTTVSNLFPQLRV